MTYHDDYVSYIKTRGSSRYERVIKSKQREFSIYFRDAPNKEDCYIDGVKSQAIFQDHSQSNNKDLSDDKYVILPKETKAGIGSYIDWRENQWLVFTEEEKTISTHQQMKVKIVNWNIKWLDDNGKVVNGGKGYGAYVQNQTLYTLGVSFTGNQISVVNGKMMMYVQNNSETRNIKIGKRVFIGNSIYKILFADIVSRQGLINLLMEQDTISDNDNVELGVADYYNSVEPEKPIENNAEIIGEETAKISKTYTYKISEGYKVDEWIVESLATEQPAYTLERDEGSLTLQFKDDFRFVGQSITIFAILSDKTTISFPVRVIKKF